MTLFIGLDLDNTIIRYDRAFAAAASARGLIPPDFSGSKQQICDRVRAAPDGEQQWQALQGYVYGKGIDNAELFDGVTAFLARARAEGAELRIVSHKTQFGHHDPYRVDLRKAAKAFLKRQGVFDYLPEDQLFFAADRAEKIARIEALRCHIFVDDLPEVFADAHFPGTVRKMLFGRAPADKLSSLEACASWAEIEHAIFDAANPAHRK